MLLTVVSPADEIFLRYGKEEKDGKKTTVLKSVRGKIDPDKNTSPSKVVYTVTGGDREIDTSNVSGIAFDREDPGFGAIRGHTDNGEYPEAMEQYEKLAAAVKGKQVTLATPALEAEFAFLGAYLPAMQLLEGSANLPPGPIAAKLNDFIAKNPQNFRFYLANETAGRMSTFIPGDKLEYAKKFYGRLAADRESKEIAYRGKLLMARAMIRDKQYPPAVALLQPMVTESTISGRGMAAASRAGESRIGRSDRPRGQPRRRIENVISHDRADPRGRR
ncbi:MAG: hypothetical protein QM811_28350 [Pirellulales bacterium]